MNGSAVDVACSPPPLLPGSDLDRSSGRALEKFYDHFFKETDGDPIPFGTTEKMHVLIEVIGASAGIYSWPPAWAYGRKKPDWLKYTLIITNPLSNVLFLIKATDDMLATVSMELGVPFALNGILIASLPRESCIKYTKMFVGSIVCAVPFAIATYLFPLPRCDSNACLATITAHSLVANTILHAISWNFILTPELWYYRLPFIPFEKAYAWGLDCYYGAERKAHLEALQETHRIYQKYKDHFIRFFECAVKSIIMQYLDNAGSENNEIVLRKLGTSNASLIPFANLVADLHVAETREEVASRSVFVRCAACVHALLSNGGVGLFGGGFMLAGTIGWIASPVYLAYKAGLTPVESGFAGFLPAYSTAVLCAFYGAATFNQIYQYFTSYDGNTRHKFSFAARRYKKTFGLFLLCNLYLSVFSYAVAQELIITLFGAKMWDDYRPYVQDISIPAMQILSFIPLLALFDTLITTWVAKFGEESDDKLAARLLTKLAVIPQRLSQMDGDVLMRSIGQYTPEQQKTLGIIHDAFVADCDQLTALRTCVQSRVVSVKLGCCRNNFWSRRSKAPDKLREQLLAPGVIGLGRNSTHYGGV